MNLKIAALLFSLPLLSSSLWAHEYEVNVGTFDKVDVSDNINVNVLTISTDVIDNDKNGKAYFDVPESMADAVMFTNNNGKLKITVATDYTNSPQLPVVTLYTPFITEVENDGTGTLTVENPSPCPRFKARLIGNGKIIAENLQASNVDASLDTGCGTIVLSGTAAKLNVKLVGTGVIQADRLQTTDANIKIMGGGTVAVDTRNILEVKGIGSTKIYYKGEPLKIKKSGGGKLIQMD